MANIQHTKTCSDISNNKKVMSNCIFKFCPMLNNGKLPLLFQSGLFYKGLMLEQLQTLFRS